MERADGRTAQITSGRDQKKEKKKKNFHRLGEVWVILTQGTDTENQTPDNTQPADSQAGGRMLGDGHHIKIWPPQHSPMVSFKASLPWG